MRRRGAPLAPYGMMGGRERAVISLLCPGVDHEAVLVSSRGRKEPVCLGPSDTFRYCIDHSERELGKDARFIPHAPGQFLWPQLSFAIQHHGDRVFVDDQNSTAHAKRRRLKRLIAELLAFDERTDPSRPRESTVSMMERVQELRRSDALSDALATIWDEAAAERDALTAESAELGTFEKSMADLSAWYRDRRDQPFSEDEQRARIGAWKSV